MNNLKILNEENQIDDKVTNENNGTLENLDTISTLTHNEQLENVAPKMNIYEKLQWIKLELTQCNLKKTGENKFAKFKYYQLEDFMPDIIRLCVKYKVCTIFNFYESHAILEVVDCENIDKFQEISIYSPTGQLEIKGANAMQMLGGAQTYMRRYLYMNMFDITENDTFDKVVGQSANFETLLEIQKLLETFDEEKHAKILENILQNYHTDGLQKLTENQALEVIKRLNNLKVKEPKTD